MEKAPPLLPLSPPSLAFIPPGFLYNLIPCRRGARAYLGGEKKTPSARLETACRLKKLIITSVCLRNLITPIPKSGRRSTLAYRQGRRPGTDGWTDGQHQPLPGQGASEGQTDRRTALWMEFTSLATHAPLPSPLTLLWINNA